VAFSFYYTAAAATLIYSPLLGSLVLDLFNRLVLELFYCIYYYYPPPVTLVTLGMAPDPPPPICCDCLLTMSLLFSLSSMTMCICCCCCLGAACRFDFELLFSFEWSVLLRPIALALVEFIREEV
jgi:hypothetical protein